MKTTVIAALCLFAGALGSQAPSAEAAPTAHTKPGPGNGRTLYTVTCHYVQRTASGGTRSGVSSSSALNAAEAMSAARRGVPSNAQVTGCQTSIQH
ncbi:hypothetical protein [Segniliparus rugosus]|uniref:Uncharacterized protein n=1 Tax=Segniliparus rugosus (strain ATCC BAA-974 / DSM 45345 / CCUG 50838 / CIP 108380 / JCM 13579 / CDC 945) TaxID=679197 RepID=E5XN17_SEGRC|nr:hypothetical protein [Segniliparus rugosus]EFV14275.2 hypothetical protein HMPREF9336_00887 [Segniliparus rugosus ATCC BAA-974]